MCTVDSALSESAALWALLAALQRPQPQVQVCDASSWRLWPLCLLQRMVINYPLPPLLYYIKKLTCPIYILFVARWWSFDDMNLERLRLTMAMKTPEDHMFNFDPKIVDWDDYFTKIHIPGVLKYLCKWSLLSVHLLLLHLLPIDERNITMIVVPVLWTGCYQETKISRLGWYSCIGEAPYLK